MLKSESVIGVVEYGMGNINSIVSKLLKNKINTVVIKTKQDFSSVSKIILPGVGHFGKGIQNLKELGLFDVLQYRINEEKIPIFGICLGMQLFAKHSEEGNSEGLGFIDGKVKKFNSDNDKGLKIPHVGWNSINKIKTDLIFADVSDSQSFYFTHSYYLECNENVVISKTNYIESFVSSIRKDNIVGTQFHPEKSHFGGFQLILNFCLQNA